MRRKHLKSIHTIHCKYTAEKNSITMPVPETVSISMGQHIGAPCKALVKKGDYVKVGQKIGDTDAFVSAPIHSSVSGKVREIEHLRNITGTYNEGVVITTDGKQEISEEVRTPEMPESREEFIQQIRESGLVGLGGAAFPTHIKFNPKNLAHVDTLVINGAECEPYITSDHRLMIEDTEDLLDGIQIVMRYLELKKCYIGIEDNKKDAIAKIHRRLRERGMAHVEVVILQSKYPKGAERVLIYETTGKTMDAGVLPAELGVILSNIGTIAFVGQYYRTGMPLVNKRVTVDGSGVSTSQNVIVPIGTTIASLVEFCGGYKGEPEKIIMGGPMMGRAIFTDELPIIKNNNAILVFTGDDGLLKKETACINCGRCTEACPFGLLPKLLNNAYMKRDVDMLRKLNIMECMECGSCAYVCPAGKPIGFLNSFAKSLVKEMAGN